MKGQRLSYHSAAILLPILAGLTPPIVAFTDFETCFVATGRGRRYRHFLEVIAFPICQGTLHAAPRNAEPLKYTGANVPRKRRLWGAEIVDIEQGMIHNFSGWNMIER